jgi:hypothetical protein
MTRPRRITQAIAGLALAAVGTTGLAAVWSPASAAAQPGADGHAAMHAMLEAVHGQDAVARMHDAGGVEEMMDQCAGMMEAMGGMSDMMNGRGMSNMMNGMMGR